MANKIILKKTSTASKVPLSTDLEVGEIAVNLADQKLYTKNASGTVILVGSGISGAGDVVGPASATDNALARFDSTTGKLIQNGNITQDDNGNLANVNAVSFDTTPASLPTTAGSMYWDEGNKTPTVIINTDVALQLGQEMLALVYNGTGSTITNGSVVAVSGAQGQRPSVVLADADSESLSAPTLGIATEDIANGAEGFVTTFGFVRGLNTSAFTAGAPIYLSQTAGQFTATRPSAPAHTVALGWVIKVNASSGEVFVNINNGWELDELHNVLITSPISGNTLIYDASVGVWKNANLTAGTGISVTNGAGSITIANTGVTSVSGTAPISSSGGTTPAISISQATTSTNGYLSSTDWNTFNGKQATLVSGTNIKTVNSTSLLGSGNLAVGTVTSVGGTGTVNGLTLSGTVTGSGNLTLGGTLSNVSLSSQVTGTLPIANGGTNADTSSKAVMNLNNATSQANIGGTTTFTSSTGRVQIFTGTLSNTIKLPDCTTTISTGWEFEIINKSTQSLPVVSFDSSSVGSIPSGCTAIITRLTNTTDNTATYWGIAVITSTLGTVTSVTGTAPISSTGGTTPAISISQASSTTNGYLSSTDWNTFNNKTSNTGTVTSVSATVPTGLSISGSPITTSGTLAITYTAGYAIPTTASQTNWDTAYSDRLKWDGGSTGLVAATGRTSLGATTVGANFFTLTNPTAVTFPRINADNTVSALDAATFRSAIGAGTGSGTVTSVTGGSYLTGGTITSSGTLAVDATSANTASKVVARDASGNFSAGTITASLSGNATTASTASNANLLNSISAVNLYNNMGQTHSTRTSFEAQGAALSSDFGYRFVQGNTNAPNVGNTGNGQYYAWNIGLGSDYAYNQYGAQFAIPRNATTPYLSVRFEEGGVLGAWQKLSAGYADSAGSVTNAHTAGTGLSGSTYNGSGAVTWSLATSGVSANTYGSSTAIPVITVDAYGRITSASTATVSGGQYFGTAATKAIAYNANSISENITVTAGNNGLSAGPITISTGFTVTVQTGANWVIV